MNSPSARAPKRILPSLFFPLIVFAYLLSAATAHLAQTSDSNVVLRGRVTDQSGSVLTGASVTLSNLTTGLERVAVTDTSGNFAFSSTRGGRYRLIVSAVGFVPNSREVESGSSVSLDFALEPAALAEKITVVSGSRQEELRESLNTKVDVIGRARIRDTGYESVAEALQELPGVVTRRGSQGAGAAGEQVQGVDSRQVLSLFDGQPIIGGKGIKRGVINLDRQSTGALFYQVIGNPNLRPEYAHSVQLGSEFTSAGRRARFGVNIFRNDIDDLIDSVNLGFIATAQQLQQIAAVEGIDLTAFRPALGRLLFLYKNITKAVTQGVEFDGEALLPSGFSLNGAYTYLNARDTKNHAPLLNRHKRQGYARLAWESNSRLGLRANLRGSFYSKWINTLATVNPTTGVVTSPAVIPPGFCCLALFSISALAQTTNSTSTGEPMKADPAAWNLLKSARETSQNFPSNFAGVTVDIVFNDNSKVTKGSLNYEVGQTGELKIEGLDEETQGWLNDQTRSIIAHRFGSGTNKRRDSLGRWRDVLHG